MKKQLSKPENWQDFESLCKKLFGELWDCRNTIRKNGRSGQDQSGVDIYAIPKGEDAYFGIQCKGKDDYTKAKVTQKEITTEIAKAQKFEPKLKVFIIATTANKDAALEAFIRKEDLKSRSNGCFEIQLYSWEDLVDLIEENRETFIWYMNEQKFRNKFEVVLSVNDATQNIICPVYTREVTYYISQSEYNRRYASMNNLMAVSRTIAAFNSQFSQPKTKYNFTICPLIFVLKNTGSQVLEDWKLKIEFKTDEVKSLQKDYDGEVNEHRALLMGISRLNHIPQPLIVDTKKMILKYQSLHNQPLIQLDQKTFQVWVQPVNHKQASITLSWELLARDFNTGGKIILSVKPILERYIKEVPLNPDENKKEKAEKIYEKIASREDE